VTLILRAYPDATLPARNATAADIAGDAIYEFTGFANSSNNPEGTTNTSSECRTVDLNGWAGLRFTNPSSYIRSEVTTGSTGSLTVGQGDTYHHRVSFIIQQGDLVPGGGAQLANCTQVHEVGAGVNPPFGFYFDRGGGGSTPYRLRFAIKPGGTNVTLASYAEIPYGSRIDAKWVTFYSTSSNGTCSLQWRISSDPYDFSGSWSSPVNNNGANFNGTGRIYFKQGVYRPDIPGDGSTFIVDHFGYWVSDTDDDLYELEDFFVDGGEPPPAGDGVVTIEGTPTIDKASWGTTARNTSHTVTADTNCLVVLAAHRGNRTVNSMAFNGDALTQIGSYSQRGTTVGCSMWRLVNPDVGTFNLATAFSAGDNNILAIVNLGGVDTTDPVGTAVLANNFDNTPPPGVNVTADDGWLVLDIAAIKEEATLPVLTIGADQSYITGIDTGGEIQGTLRAGASSQDGAASVSMDWTMASSKDWAQIAAPFKAAAAAEVIVEASTALATWEVPQTVPVTRISHTAGVSTYSIVAPTTSRAAQPSSALVTATVPQVTGRTTAAHTTAEVEFTSPSPTMSMLATAAAAVVQWIQVSHEVVGSAGGPIIDSLVSVWRRRRRR
jgi:hypothetical protein